MIEEKTFSEALEKLREGFVSHDILDAVDRFDDVRPTISDEGYRPPEIRGQLLKLHGMVMKIVNYTGNDDKKGLARALILAEEIDMEIFGCIENLEKISDVLGRFRNLGAHDDWEDPDEDEDMGDL